MPNKPNNPNIQISEEAKFLQKHYNLIYNPITSDPCQKVEEYVERKGEVERFEKDLSLATVSPLSSYMIIANRGLGKTSFANICIQGARKRSLTTVYVDSVPRSAGKFIKKLLIVTIEAETDPDKKKSLASRYGNYVRAAEKDTYRTFDLWTQIVDKLQPKPVIVVIDETDNLPKISHIAPQFNSYIFSHTKDVVFLLCALPETYKKMHDTMGAFTDRFPLMIDLLPFSKAELILCLEKKLAKARIKKALGPHPFRGRALEKMLEYANGIPRYMLEIAKEAIRIGVEKRATRIDEKIIDEAASRTQITAIDKTWPHLTYMERETLLKITELGQKEIKLRELAATLKRDKSTIIPYLNKLDAVGIIQRVGKRPAEIAYQLLVDPQHVKRLARIG